jgi:transcriptional regulator with PAS, ATPase and Fis domain
MTASTKNYLMRESRFQATISGFQKGSESKHQFSEIQEIFEGIADLVFVIDKNRCITKVNGATCEAFKKRPEDLIDKHCYEVVHGADCHLANCPATKIFETNQTITEEINDSKLGVPLLVTTLPILDVQGEVASGCSYYKRHL